jgi:adenine-specific DNA-methyltransferase
MLAGIEQKRQSVQITLDAAKTMLERNILGQYATAPKLADDILEYAKGLLPDDSKIKFLDPAFGTGAFYSALLKTFPNERIISAAGFEKDERVAKESRNLWQSTSLNLRLMDFTKADLPSEADKANLIICNPPYVRHHHLSRKDKERLQKLSELITGIKFNGLTGFYCYFLAICHAWMTENGTAGWLIPSEFMDVNYGQEVKRYLLENVTLLRVHRYDPTEVQFDDALVSSSVVWFTKKLPASDHQIEFTYGGTLEKPKLSKFVSSTTAASSRKWTTLPFTKASVDHSSKTVKLSELFTVKRGIATGANEFFILSPEQIAQYELPKRFLTPILPSPRFLQTGKIEADGEGEPLLVKKLYLLNCELPEQIIKSEYPTLWNYLQKGVEMGISERFLCKSRKSWYLQEKRPPAPILCTYMGKNRENRKPFRFILNHSKATAANVYLMIYPNPSLFSPAVYDTKFIESVWRQLNDIPCNEVMDQGRVYGGGLHKIEPKELGNILIELPQICS